MAKRSWYEVRVREYINGKPVKKSRFYQEKGPGEARRHYHGGGTVMSVTKVGVEGAHPKCRIGRHELGLGCFFRAGSDLVMSLNQEGGEVDVVERMLQKDRELKLQGVK